MHAGPTRATVQIRVKVKIECAASGLAEAGNPGEIHGERIPRDEGTRNIGGGNK